jgi:hypothetical protein
VSAITLQQHPAFDDRPVHGPPCPGVETHRWSLSIDCGEWFLTSGCQECDWVYETEDVLVRPISGRMAWEREHAEADCPSFLDGPCDHAYWVRFIPEGQP